MDLQRLEAGVKGIIRKAPQVIGETVAEDIRANFIRQGTLSDEGFEPWIPSMAALKEGRRTLIKTGKLMNSVGYETTLQSAIIGIDTTQVPYAEYAGEGTSKMVRRAFIVLRKEAVDGAMKKLIEEMIRKQ